MLVDILEKITYCMSRHYTYIQAIENVIPTHQDLEDLQ